MSAPTQWVHINEPPSGNQWVYPIWNAVNRAIEAELIGAIPAAMSELALHLTTRLHLILLAATHASNLARALIEDATRRVHPTNVCRRGEPAYVLEMSITPVYEFIVAVHSAMYETHAAAELMRNFLNRARVHANLPKSAGLKEEFKNVIAVAGEDYSWCDELERVRGFFTHQGTAYRPRLCENSISIRFRGYQNPTRSK